MENIEIWKEIHSLAAELYLLAPWKYMEETDIFGVQTALTGKTYFISIMGSAGQVRAVSAYEGNNALEQFWEMENRPDVEPETIMLIPHIMLSFDNKKNIDNTQKEIFKITGPHPGKLKEWPDLKRVIPGLFPAIPGGSSINDFAEILVQILDVCSRARHDIEFVHPDGLDDETYLILEPVTRRAKTVWHDKYRQVFPEPESFKATIKQQDIDSLRFLRKAPIVFQTHYRLLPTPVREKNLPEYFPFVVMIANKKSGIIEGLETLAPFPDYHSMIEKVPLIIVNLIRKLRFRPMRIEVKDQILYELLHPALTRSEINVTFMPSLGTIDEAFEELIGHLRKG